jgi:hypothetical protein
MKKVMIALALTGCCYSPAPSAAPVAVSAPVSPAVESAPSAPTRYHAASAIFDGATLVGCFDIESSNPIELNMDEQTHVLRVPCSEMYSDRTVIASCETPVRTEQSEGITTLLYYRTDAVGDGDSIGCVENGGTWSALPRDSREYRRARLEESTEQLQRAAERIRKRR